MEMSESNQGWYTKRKFKFCSGRRKNKIRKREKWEKLIETTTPLSQQEITRLTEGQAQPSWRKSQEKVRYQDIPPPVHTMPSPGVGDSLRHSTTTGIPEEIMGDCDKRIQRQPGL